MGLVQNVLLPNTPEPSGGYDDNAADIARVDGYHAVLQGVPERDGRRGTRRYAQIIGNMKIKKITRCKLSKYEIIKISEL